MFLSKKQRDEMEVIVLGREFDMLTELLNKK